jgi:hypothetical protein
MKMGAEKRMTKQQREDEEREAEYQAWLKRQEWLEEQWAREWAEKFREDEK